MKKFEASTLEEVYESASKEFSCSIVDLDIDIVQQPSGGFFGLFGKKSAIILAEPKQGNKHSNQNNYNKKVFKKRDIKIKDIDTDTSIKTPSETTSAQNQRKTKPLKDTNLNFDTVQKDEIFDGFYDKDNTTNAKAKPIRHNDKKQHESKIKKVNKPNKSNKDSDNQHSRQEAKQEIKQEPKKHIKKDNTPKPQKELQTSSSKEHDIKEIRIKINSLFSKSCYELDEIIVEDYEQDTIYIEFNGTDCALLIGKEGYRYKALSYMIFNWIHETYGYMIRLEVAEFLQNQEDAVNRYIDSIVDNIEMDGRGQTKPLDGILVHIALTRLRVEFPNKYVAVKTNSKRQKYIVVNDFKNR